MKPENLEGSRMKKKRAFEAGGEGELVARRRDPGVVGGGRGPGVVAPGGWFHS